MQRGYSSDNRETNYSKIIPFKAEIFDISLYNQPLFKNLNCYLYLICAGSLYREQLKDTIK